MAENDDDFWDELLGHIGQQKLVGNAEQTLTTLIGESLAEMHQLTLSPGMTTMEDAVEAFLRERGNHLASQLSFFR